MKIAIVGAGCWGTTMGIMLASCGHDIFLWTNEGEDFENMKISKINKRYVPERKLPSNIKVSMNISDICKKRDVLIFALPSHVIREMSRRIKPFFDRKIIFLNLAKGFEEKTHMRMSEIIFEELGNDINYVALSGPNIATEIAQGLPAAAAIAGTVPETLGTVQKELSSKTFKIYLNEDLTGLEVGGSVKNIIAIASGFVEGKALGINARAQLVSRGMAEMIRLGVKLGAKEKTFMGLSGLGDLITTCFSSKSRNFSFGYRVGRGMSVKDALKANHMVIEGVKTCRVVYEMAEELEIDMPITTEIYNGIYKNKSPDDVLKSLLARPLKME